MRLYTFFSKGAKASRIFRRVVFPAKKSMDSERLRCSAQPCRILHFRPLFCAPCNSPGQSRNNVRRESLRRKNHCTRDGVGRREPIESTAIAVHVAIQRGHRFSFLFPVRGVADLLMQPCRHSDDHHGCLFPLYFPRCHCSERIIV